MAGQSLITVDPEILGGTPVFSGTRVPVKTLFEYLEDNYSLDQFIECFPTVSHEMAHRTLLANHTCRTAQEMGWKSVKNGDLLTLAEAQFDLFITSD